MEGTVNDDQIEEFVGAIRAQLGLTRCKFESEFTYLEQDDRVSEKHVLGLHFESEEMMRSEYCRLETANWPATHNDLAALKDKVTSRFERERKRKIKMDKIDAEIDAEENN